MKTDWGKRVLIAATFAYALAVSGALQVFVRNRLELQVAAAEFFGYLTVAFLATAAGALVLLYSRTGRRPARRGAILAALTALLSIQCNVLLWDYGLLDGREIDWGSWWLRELGEWVLWAAILAAAIRWADLAYARLAIPVCILALLMGTVPPALLTFQQQAPASPYRLDRSKAQSFSASQNVIVLVIDSLQSDIFAELVREDEQFAEAFDGFTYFRNSVSGYRESYPSVANILTGTFYDNSVPMQEYLRSAFLSASSLPKILLDAGYRVDVFSTPVGVLIDPRVMSNAVPEAKERDTEPDQEIARLFDVGLFRCVPQTLKRLVYNDQEWLFSRPVDRAPESRGQSRAPRAPLSKRFDQQSVARLKDVRFVNNMLDLAAADEAANTFKYFHLSGIHLPPKMDRNFNYVSAPIERESLLETGRGVLGLVRLLFEKLKEIGVYDNSLIFVLADHGVYRPGLSPVSIAPQIAARHGSSGGAGTPPFVKGAVVTTMLVKRLGARGEMTVLDAPVQNADVPKTALTELGHPVARVPGRSMFDVAETEPRIRKVNFSTYQYGLPYSAPNRTRMDEYEVTGFSWLDASWRKTGRSFAPLQSEVPRKFR